jgi:hypothetical protein
VERRLGRGRSGAGVAVYQLGRAKLEVGYDGLRRVRQISLHRAPIAAYGQSLSRRRDAVKLLKAHGWRVATCKPYTVAQHFGRHGASGVIWNGEQIFVAGVTRQGGIDVCPLGSPGNP